MARDIALTHHERFDGKGYPNGLKGETIPLTGRITVLADVYDALTSKRVYKPAFSHEEAQDHPRRPGNAIRSRGRRSLRSARRRFHPRSRAVRSHGGIALRRRTRGAAGRHDRVVTGQSRNRKRRSLAVSRLASVLATVANATFCPIDTVLRIRTMEGNTAALSMRSCERRCR